MSTLIPLCSSGSLGHLRLENIPYLLLLAAEASPARGLGQEENPQCQPWIDWRPDPGHVETLVCRSGRHSKGRWSTYKPWCCTANHESYKGCHLRIFRPLGVGSTRNLKPRSSTIPNYSQIICYDMLEKLEEPICSPYSHSANRFEHLKHARHWTRPWGLNSEKQYACPQRACVVLPSSKAGIKPNKEHSHIAQSRYPILKLEEQDFWGKGCLNRDLINQKKSCVGGAGVERMLQAEAIVCSRYASKGCKYLAGWLRE